MDPFAIHCTTCKARLLVKDEAVIGDILACPKCHSMVQVVPPPGWSRGAAPAENISPLAPRATQSGAAPKPAETPTAATPTATTPTPVPSTPVPATPVPATPVPAQTVDTMAASSATLEVKSAVVPPALPTRAARPTTPSAPAPATVSSAESAAATAVPASAPVDTTNIPSAAEVVPTSPGALANTLAWARREWVLLSGAAAGVALGSIVWLVVAWVFAEPTVAVLPEIAQAPSETTRPNNSPPGEATKPTDEGAPTNEGAPAPAAPSDEPLEATEPAEAAPVNPQTVAENPVASAPPGTKATEAPTPPAPAPAEQPPAGTHPEGTPPAGPTFKLDPAAAHGANPVQDTPALEPTDEKPTANDEPDESPAADPMPEDPAEDPSGSPGDPVPLDQDEIVRRMRVTLAAVEFNKVPLVQFAEFLSQASGVPVVLDEAGLAKARQHRRSLISVKLGGTTAAATMQAALKPLGLSASIRKGQIVIGAK